MATLTTAFSRHSHHHHHHHHHYSYGVQVVELMCQVLGRRDAGSEGLRAMAAVLLRTLFDFRSDVWRRLQPHTKTGGMEFS